ncbi:hypothetical protein F5876DRAFT_65815 [Lentinula aff. lateritia]|uniref:Uncharacterized protein n=1 Tax=Lentinula aff. lateritia TaxID=2804960 RepID=A0ACC1U002_9AGAR|nr:hypothetical protein F5876DRAFT_65815 [Lentinula aff. lateritia]
MQATQGAHMKLLVDTTSSLQVLQYNLEVLSNKIRISGVQTLPKQMRCPGLKDINNGQRWKLNKGPCTHESTPPPVLTPEEGIPHRSPPQGTLKPFVRGRKHDHGTGGPPPGGSQYANINEQPRHCSHPPNPAAAPWKPEAPHYNKRRRNVDGTTRIAPSSSPIMSKKKTIQAYQEARAVGVGAPNGVREPKGRSQDGRIKVPVLVEQGGSLKEALKELAHWTMDIWGALKLVEGGGVLTRDA